MDQRKSGPPQKADPTTMEKKRAGKDAGATTKTPRLEPRRSTLQEEFYHSSNRRVK